jgi:uncharacterized protein (DUF2147 family)
VVSTNVISFAGPTRYDHTFAKFFNMFPARMRSLPGRTEDRMLKSWFAALGILGVSAPALAQDATGTWLVEDKTAVIKVEPCEAGMCGAIGWAQTPGTDKNNADPKLRSRNIIGLRFITMKAAGKNRWEGEIYNAKDGKTYSGNLTLADANTLKIQGCVMGFLCGGETWTRTKCDEPPATGAAAAPGAQAKRPPDKSAPKTAAASAAPGAIPAGLPLTGCRGVVTQ